MRKTILYIAMSLDGYIARTNGDVSWLGGQNQEIDNMDSYQTFIKNIGTVSNGLEYL